MLLNIWIKQGKVNCLILILMVKIIKKSLASYLWNFALRFMTHKECGALEAADTLLRIFLYGTDRNTTNWMAKC